MPQQTIFIVEAKTVCLPREKRLYFYVWMYVMYPRGVQSILFSLSLSPISLSIFELYRSFAAWEAVLTASFVATFITHIRTWAFI